MRMDLKKYMSANKFWWKVLTGLFELALVVFIISAIAGNDVKPVGLVVFLVGLGLSLIPQYKSKRFYAELEASGKLPQIEADLKGAVAMRRNTVRFGNYWIFTKGKERLLRYQDIAQIFQYVHRTNFVENERLLKYVDKKGKQGVLCKLELRGRSDDEVLKMISMILSKNPGVKVGYD